MAAESRDRPERAVIGQRRRRRRKRRDVTGGQQQYGDDEARLPVEMMNSTAHVDDRNELNPFAPLPAINPTQSAGRPHCFSQEIKLPYSRLKACTERRN